jgi:hypothetical protein
MMLASRRGDSNEDDPALKEPIPADPADLSGTVSPQMSGSN